MNVDLNDYAQRQAVVHHDHLISFLALGNMTASKDALIFLLEKTLREPLTPIGRKFMDAALEYVRSEE